MSTNQLIASQTESPCAQEPSTAARLRDLTGFSLLDCKKALVTCDHDLTAAKRWLAYGKWMSGKLISWDHAALAEKAKRLELEFRLGCSRCESVLKECGGNEALARERLLGVL